LIIILKKFGFYLNNKKKIYLIESEENEEFVKESLQKEKCIGLDTEFNWRNTYFPELSLLQISTSSKILLIDCLKFNDLGFLNKVLEDKTKKIIMHSSRSDTTVLNTNLNVKLNNCFDIQIAEKHINGGEIKNYGSIVSKYCGYELDKSETNSNWLKRPLTDEQLKYAADDVNFLIFIYETQLKKLKKLKKEKVVNLEFTKEIRLGNQELHISRLRKLKKASNVEKDIFLWREKYAKKKNIPPSYVFGNKDLKKISNKIKNKEKGPYEIKKLFKDNSAAKDFLKYIKL
jgi:ribonuclease D